MEIMEKRRCMICNEEFYSDVIWEREFKIRIRYEIFTDEFFNLCPRHKFILFRDFIYMLYMKGEITKRDLEKMNISSYML